MTEKINWTLNVQVVGGPKILASDTIDVDAYDKIDVTIEPDASEKEVQIQPGDLGQVQFLLIKSDQYGDGLTYKVNDASSDAIITLDALQVLIGDGAVGLFKGSPEKLLFTNNLVSDGDKIPASIQILVGRKAT
ncbi:MAG: hypothetical protein IMF03_03005 [Proteobacteria bacterium]|jgi:hypothetical protein|nr:hypothetical protein [Pseudomonadota bacterium]